MWNREVLAIQWRPTILLLLAMSVATARAHGVAFGTLEPSPSLQEALIERVLPVE